MENVLSIKEFERITSSPHLLEDHSAAAGCDFLVVDCQAAEASLAASALPNTVIIGLGATKFFNPALDVVATDAAALEVLGAAISAQPQAAYLLCQVLRANAEADLRQGLLNESLAYSTLQHAAGFQRWLSTQTSPRQAERSAEEVLLIDREADVLTLTLNRPNVHNAYNAALKDALCSALHAVHADREIQQVVLRGNGPSFCAGGDLFEFGLAEDAALAHISRTTRSAAWLLGTLPCPSLAQLKGACIGAGIELPAFSRQVIAEPNSYFVLPEVGMGLIPGAGGTVSIPARIGRQRTAWMALTGARIEPPQALAWGLIDEIKPSLS